MFDPQSRYARIAEATIDVPAEGGGTRPVRYKKRRFIPSSLGSTTIAEHTVKQGERLDLITARYLGDPTQFHRICDANGVLSPGELTETVGRRIRIAMPSI